MIAAPPAPVALSVAPAHVALAAGTATPLRVRAPGRPGLLLRASVAGLALDRHGRPVVARGDAGTWLVVRPRTIRTERSGNATFVVAARRPAGARPGDHSAIVLLTAFAPGTRAIAVAVRLGVVVTVRVPGHKLRRLAIVAVRSRVGRISLTIANRGDVIESIGGGSLQIAVARRGRTLARFRAPRRALLPHTRALLRFRPRRPLHGAVTVLVSLTQPTGTRSDWRFPLRL